jgi:site-specific recombinase
MFRKQPRQTDALVAHRAASRSWRAVDPIIAMQALLRDLPTLSDHASRIDWVARLGTWLHAAPSAREDRLQAFLSACEREDALRRALHAVYAQVLLDTSGLKLFADTGLPSEFGFLSEAVNRVAFLVLPAPRDPTNLAEVLEALVPTKDDAEWVAEMPAALFASVTALLAEQTDVRVATELREDLLDAVTVLAANVASLGVSKDVLDRLSTGRLTALPFVALTHDCERLASVVRGQPDDAGQTRTDAARMVTDTIARCRGRVGQVVAHVETQGVSMHLIYRLEKLNALLDRLESIVLTLALPGEHTEQARRAFVATLVRGIHLDKSVRALIRGNLRQLSRKVVERTGDAATHYLVASRSQWWQMFAGAAGGGFLTVFTIALKFAIIWASLSLLFEGLALALNYAGSFMLMQLLGFKLATKQPAMFAASMADTLLDRRNRLNPAGFTEEVARVTRSQMAAVAGNIGVVIPAALAFDFGWRLLTGHAFLDPESAAYAVTSLDPLGSATLAFAALTGAILMVSSIAGGWFENFVVYRRVPEAIAQHRVLHRWIGPARALSWSHTFTHGVAGIATCLVLGLLLGMLPVIGTFAGLPLDVRHVTLSTGQLALGVSALGAGAFWSWATAMALIGVVAIGALNFGVSFVLALLLAIRAREVTVRSAAHLMRDTVWQCLRHPWTFVVPPPGAVPEPVLAEHVPPEERMAIDSPEHDLR